MIKETAKNTFEIIPEHYPFRILAMADSHVPDHQKDLPEELIRAIFDEAPDLLLHAGDVSRDEILDRFRERMQVYAVRGNRDLLRGTRYPARLRFEIGDISLFLCHGEGDPLHYLLTKGYCLLADLFRRKPDPERLNHFPRESRTADIVIYGHTHVDRLDIRNGRLFINPGSSFAGGSGARFLIPSYALLEIRSDGSVSVEIHQLRADGNLTSGQTFFRRVKSDLI